MTIVVRANVHLIKRALDIAGRVAPMPILEKVDESVGYRFLGFAADERHAKAQVYGLDENRNRRVSLAQIPGDSRNFWLVH